MAYGLREPQPCAFRRGDDPYSAGCRPGQVGGGRRTPGQKRALAL